MDFPKKIAFSVDEITKLVGIGRTTVYAAIKSGQLASITIGKRRLILRPDLLAFLDRRRAGAAEAEAQPAASGFDREQRCRCCAFCCRTALDSS